MGEEKEKLKQSEEVLRKVLKSYCDSYVATLFAQTLSVNSAIRRMKADDNHILKFSTGNLDWLRVKIHNAIQKFFDIDMYEDGEKGLNCIFGALGSRIGLPLPDHRNAGVPQSPNTVSEKELINNFDSYVEKYGGKLCNHLIEWGRSRRNEAD